jgi:acetyl esterase/lipase
MARPLAFLFLVTILAGTAAAQDDRKAKIEAIEKQLAELQKQLDELKKPSAPQPKKALTLADADVWRSIRGVSLSNDGKWFAHRVGTADGDGEIVLRHVADGKETRFSAGGGIGYQAFSHDGKWLGYSITPSNRTTQLLPAAMRPKPKITLINLSTMEKSEINETAAPVFSQGSPVIPPFHFSGESSAFLVYRKAVEASPVQTGLSLGIQGPPITPTAPAGARGSDLVIRDLATGTDMVLGNVAEYGFDKKGNWLVMVIDAQGQIGNGVHIRDMKTGLVTPVETAKAIYRDLTWNRDGNAFTLLKSVEDKTLENPWYAVLGFSDLGPKPTKVEYDPKDDKSFPAGMGISTNRPMQWTDDLSAITFGLAEAKKKGAETAPTLSAAPVGGGGRRGGPGGGRGDAGTSTISSTSGKPDLALWHWKDDRLQPMQERQATSDKTFAHLGEYRVKEKKFIRLSDDECKQVTPAPKQKYAIGRDTRPYQYMSTLDGRSYSDVFVIDMATGQRKKALSKARFVGPASPTGDKFVYHDAGHFHVYDMVAGSSVNVTEKATGTAFYDTEDDHNVDKPPTQVIGWTRDGKHVILSDGWDLWKVATDGSGGTNLTVNGKADGIKYRSLVQFDPDRNEPGLDPAKPAYVSIYGEWTKKGGIGRIDPDKPGVTPVLTGDATFGILTKARNADVFAYTRSTVKDYPDYYLTDASFKDSKKVTDANPQQANYLWCPGVKLVEYKGLGRKRLQGALYLPAGYEPGKKYPTIVYIYEKLSQGLHQYTPPTVSGSGFNPSLYTSNGYAVFTPDIVYRLNDPGMSAVECVIPALDAAIATGIVDPAKVGLQGHSWGGYQTAFLVTQTNKFKAAVAGAPLTDLVSMYSSVYWNTGSANQPIFESSQGRFTAGYWDQQEAYIRNSPVYHATKVQTPLVILHNDKDGAVDFTQGVEYFNTLRRLQKPVVMLQYKGENHGLIKTENKKDYATRMKEFFDHYLMGKPAPDWWKDGVPFLKMDEYLKPKK